MNRRREEEEGGGGGGRMRKEDEGRGGRKEEEEEEEDEGRGERESMGKTSARGLLLRHVRKINAGEEGEMFSFFKHET